MATTRHDLQPIALVATDLDGTLLNSHEQVAPRTRAALHAAAENGIEVVLVTGRPPRWLPPVLDAIGLTPTCICANGAIVLESAAETITYIEALDRTDVLHAADVLRDLLPQVGFAVERAPLEHALWDHTANFGHDDDYHPRWPTAPGTVVAPLEQLVDDRPVLKLLARSEREYDQAEVDAILAQAREALGRRLEVTHSERDRLLLEMSAVGVDKGTALARVAADRGLVAAQVAAVGDMLNDLPMIEWAGHGYTVANGHEALHEIAPSLPSNDDFGVADLLEGIVQGKQAWLRDPDSVLPVSERNRRP